MDSVSQKNNILSMTGIDQTEENTESISELQNLVFPFVKNVAPYIVQKNKINQIIDGEKTFLNPIITNGFKPIKYTVMGSDFYEPITFNPSGKYQMSFDFEKGLDVSAPIRLRNDALIIANIKGLQDALNTAANTEIHDRSVTTTKIALNTILGENLNSAISIDTTGDISAIGGTFAVCNNVICKSGNYQFQNSAPLLNVSIPCFPKIITGTRNFDLHFQAINNVSYLPYIYPFDFTIHSIAIRAPHITDSFQIAVYKFTLEFRQIKKNPIAALPDIIIDNDFTIDMSDSYIYNLQNQILVEKGYKLFLKATNVFGYVEWLNFEIHGYQC
jgi:hypothetical protein